MLLMQSAESYCVRWTRAICGHGRNFQVLTIVFHQISDQVPFLSLRRGCTCSDQTTLQSLSLPNYAQVSLGGKHSRPPCYTVYYVFCVLQMITRFRNLWSLQSLTVKSVTSSRMLWQNRCQARNDVYAFPLRSASGKQRRRTAETWPGTDNDRMLHLLHQTVLDVLRHPESEDDHQRRDISWAALNFVCKMQVDFTDWQHEEKARMIPICCIYNLRVARDHMQERNRLVMDPAMSLEIDRLFRADDDYRKTWVF